MLNSNLSIIDLGFCDYGLALQKQKELWQKRLQAQIPDTLILVEHPPVFTIGKHGKTENLLISESLLKEKNIQLCHIERGGDITFHGPGQLVGYPIFMLTDPLINIKQFIHNLENCLCRVLDIFGIKAIVKHPYIGVWVKEKKIASIGIAVSKRVTFHGFALNVSTDLDYFKYINPCGDRNIEMTSMAEMLGQPIPMEKIKEKIAIEFNKTF